jgi:hypothetical protein
MPGRQPRAVNEHADLNVGGHEVCAVADSRMNGDCHRICPGGVSKGVSDLIPELGRVRPRSSGVGGSGRVGLVCGVVAQAGPAVDQYSERGGGVAALVGRQVLGVDAFNLDAQVRLSSPGGPLGGERWLGLCPLWAGTIDKAHRNSWAEAARLSE